MTENNNIKYDSKQQSALDLPFNEQVHIILQSYEVEQSDNEYEKTCITEDGFARIYASDLVIVIQPEEEVMHISTLNQVHTYSHDFCEWDNFDAETFPHGGINYVWWLDHLRKALFEIIDLLETPASGETLFEEQVIAVLERHKKGYAKFWITENGLKINFNASTVVLGDGGWDRVKIGNNPEKTYSRAGLKRQVENKSNGNALGWWGNHAPVILEIIELLETQDDDAEEVHEDPDIVVDLRLKLARTENHLKHWKERAELRERERDASRLEYGKLMTKHQGLEDEHHELNEKYINYSSVYEHKIEQQEERICKLIDRLKLYQAAYEQEFLKSMEPKKGVTSGS